jgi:chaperonin GroES
MIKPLFNNILVEKLVEEKKTASGIILDTVTDTSVTFKSKIVAKGPDALSTLEVGDTVILSRYQRGTDLEHEGKSYIITPDKDILATL